MPRYYEFDVSLQEIQPRIWRRFLLRTTSSFAHLHMATQESFGWQNCHLWEFRTPGYDGRPIAGIPNDEYEDRPTPDGHHVKLSEYFSGGRVTEWCEYVYDFGDDWVHDVKLLRVVSDKQAFKRRLLAGEFACPPEDCGGFGGYERMVHVVQNGEDPWDESVEETLAWLDGWRPDALDLDSMKAAFDG